MLARLDGAFASQRHFVANASHELRTPLAIMRTEVDVALADPDASVAELREMGEAVRDMVDRCERLIASLLLLARSEAAAGHEEPVDIAALAADCITDLWARAEEAQIEVRDDLEPAWTTGDPGLLERLIANLRRQRHPPQRARRLPRGQTRASGDAGRAPWSPTAASRSIPSGCASWPSRSGAWIVGARLRAGAVDRPLDRRGPPRRRPS